MNTCMHIWFSQLSPVGADGGSQIKVRLNKLDPNMCIVSPGHEEVPRTQNILHDSEQGRHIALRVFGKLQEQCGFDPRIRKPTHRSIAS